MNQRSLENINGIEYEPDDPNDGIDLVSTIRNHVNTQVDKRQGITKAVSRKRAKSKIKLQKQLKYGLQVNDEPSIIGDSILSSTKGVRTLHVYSDMFGFFPRKIPIVLENVLTRLSYYAIIDACNGQSTQHIVKSVLILLFFLAMIFCGVVLISRYEPYPDGRLLSNLFVALGAFVIALFLFSCVVGRITGRCFKSDRLPYEVISSLEFYPDASSTIHLRRGGKLRIIEFKYSLPPGAKPDDEEEYIEGEECKDEEQEVAEQLVKNGKPMERSDSAHWYIKPFHSDDFESTGPYTLRTMRYWYSHGLLTTFHVKLEGWHDRWHMTKQIYPNDQTAFLSLPIGKDVTWDDEEDDEENTRLSQRSSKKGSKRFSLSDKKYLVTTMK